MDRITAGVPAHEGGAVTNVHAFVLGLVIGLLLDSAFTFVQRTLYRRKLKKLRIELPEPQTCAYWVCEGDDLEVLCAEASVDAALVRAENPDAVWELGARWKFPRALCLHLIATRGAVEKGHRAE